MKVSGRVSCEQVVFKRHGLVSSGCQEKAADCHGAIAAALGTL